MLVDDVRITQTSLAGCAKRAERSRSISRGCMGVREPDQRVEVVRLIAHRDLEPLDRVRRPSRSNRGNAGEEPHTRIMCHRDQPIIRRESIHGPAVVKVHRREEQQGIGVSGIDVQSPHERPPRVAVSTHVVTCAPEPGEHACVVRAFAPDSIQRLSTVIGRARIVEAREGGGNPTLPRQFGQLPPELSRPEADRRALLTLNPTGEFALQPPDNARLAVRRNDHRHVPNDQIRTDEEYRLRCDAVVPTIGATNGVEAPAGQVVPNLRRARHVDPALNIRLKCAVADRTSVVRIVAWHPSDQPATVAAAWGSTVSPHPVAARTWSALSAISSRSRWKYPTSTTSCGLIWSNAC